MTIMKEYEQKQEQIAVEDSNMALVGTQADKDARKGAALTEKCWEGAGDEVRRNSCFPTSPPHI